MMARYQGLMWGDLLVWILLGLAPAPNEKEINRRARKGRASSSASMVANELSADRDHRRDSHHPFPAKAVSSARDVDLLHPHHRREGALGCSSTSRS